MEKTTKSKITNPTKKNWQPLLDLIPEIESYSEFAEWDDIITEDGELNMYPCKEYSIVSKFRDLVYDLNIIIDFDWARWDEGRTIIRNKDFDYNTLDIPTNCKIITAFVRNDRFCDGALVDAFESGVILKVLKSIENTLS